MAVQQIVTVFINLKGDGTNTTFTFPMSNLYVQSFGGSIPYGSAGVVPSSIAINNPPVPVTSSTVDANGNITITLTSALGSGIVANFELDLAFNSGAATSTSPIQTDEVSLFGHANATLDVIISGGTAAANAVQVAGVFNTVAPTLTNGQGASLQLDASGNLRVAGSFSAGALPDNLGSAGTLNALNATASLSAPGYPSIGVTIAAGTLAGTVTPEYSIDGTNWFTTYFSDAATGATQASLVFTNPNPLTVKTIIGVGGASNYRVRVNVFTSGTTSAQINANSVNDPSGLTQGFVSTNVQPAFVAQNGGWVTSTAPTYATATLNSLSIDTNGNLRVVSSNGTSQFGMGTAQSSSSLGTIALGYDGTTVRGLFTDTAGKLQVGGTMTVVGNVASGATDSGNPLKTSAVFNATQPTVTDGQRINSQATARGAHIVATGVDTFNVANTGTFAVQVTGTVAVTQSTSPWVISDGGSSLTVDNAGTFAVQATGTVTANIGTTGGITVAQASTTSGQSGTLVQGAVTTSAPTYTTTQTSPLSLTTTGALRVDGSGAPLAANSNGNLYSQTAVGNLPLQADPNANLLVSVKNGLIGTSPTFVQSVAANQSISVTTFTSSPLNIVPTPGHAIVTALEFTAAVTGVTCVDSNGVALTSHTSNGLNQNYMFYGFVTQGSTGALTFSWTTSTTACYVTAEYAGVGGFGKQQNSSPSGVTTPGATITCTRTQSLAVAFFGSTTIVVPNQNSSNNSGTFRNDSGGSPTGTEALYDATANQSTFVGIVGQMSGAATWGVLILELYAATSVPVGGVYGGTVAPSLTAGQNYGLQLDVNGNLKTVATSSPAADLVGTPVALNALNAAATINAAGYSHVGMFLAAGTLIGTIVPECSLDGGTTWVTTFFNDPTTSLTSASVVFASSNTATSKSIVGVAGASNYRIRVSAFSSGTGTCTLRANEVGDPSTLTSGPVGTATQPPVTVMDGAWVTTANPTYGAGTLQPLSLTTAGAQRSDTTSVAGTALGTPTNFGTTPGAVVAQSTNASLFIGTTVAVASSAGVQKVGIAGGAAGAAIDTAVGSTAANAVTVTNVPNNTAGGALTAVVKSAQATAVNIKASAGSLYGLAITSATATAGFIMFFNTATTATTGTVWAIPIAASGTVIIPPSVLAMLNFSAGIAINVATPINGTTTQITWTGTIMFL